MGEVVVEGVEAYGIHLSSTNFLTMSSVFFALSLTLLAACKAMLELQALGVLEGRRRAYNEGDSVRHDEELLLVSSGKEFCVDFACTSKRIWKELEEEYVMI